MVVIGTGVEGWGGIGSRGFVGWGGGDRGEACDVLHFFLNDSDQII